MRSEQRETGLESWGELGTPEAPKLNMRSTSTEGCSPFYGPALCSHRQPAAHQNPREVCSPFCQHIPRQPVYSVLLVCSPPPDTQKAVPHCAHFPQAPDKGVLGMRQHRGTEGKETSSETAQGTNSQMIQQKICLSWESRFKSSVCSGSCPDLVNHNWRLKGINSHYLWSVLR